MEKVSCQVVSVWEHKLAFNFFVFSALCLSTDFITLPVTVSQWTSVCRWQVDNKKPKVFRKKPCCHPSWQRITTPQSPHWLQWDVPHLLQNCPFPFDDYHFHLIHPSLEWLHSPHQMASGSSQSFCHNTLSRHTDRRYRWQTCKNTRYTLFIV